MAVDTSAMLRTCAVRLLAIELTLSVRSFQVPATPSTLAWPPSRPSVPTSRATRVTSPAKALSWSTIVLMVSLSCRISPLTLTVIFFDRSPPAIAVATSAMLRTCAAAPARPPRHLGGEGVQLVHHGVDGFLELQDLAADVDGDLLGQVAVGDGDRHVGDVADLGGQIARHRVDAFGQVLPHAGDLAHLRLTAELAFGADLAGNPRHLGGEHAELLDHGVDDGGGSQELPLERPSVDVEAYRLQQIALRHR